MPTGKLQKLLEEKLRAQSDFETPSFELPSLDDATVLGQDTDTTAEEIQTAADLPTMDAAPEQEAPVDIPETTKAPEPEEVPFSSLSREEKLDKIYQDYLNEKKSYQEKLDEARKSDRRSQMWQGVLKGLGSAVAASYGGADVGYTPKDPMTGMKVIDPGTRKDIESDRKTRLDELMQQYKLLSPEKKLLASTETTSYQTESGDPVDRDRVTGQWYNALTKEPISSGEKIVRAYAPSYSINPYTKEVTLTDRSRGGKVISTVGAPEPTKVDGKITAVEQLKPKFQEDFQKLKDKFETQAKKTKSSLITVSTMGNLIDAAIKNPSAKAAIGAQIAEIYEEGKKTDEDVARYVKRSGLEDRIKDFIQENLISGTIAPDKAEDLKNALKEMQISLKERVNTVAMEKTKEFANSRPSLNVDVNSLVKSMYGSYSPKKQSQKAPHGEIVERKGKTYKWNAITGTYQLYNKGE